MAHKTKKIPISHPGVLLREEFMKPFGITAYRLAKDIGVPLTRVTNIIHGKRSITAETALLFAKYFRRSEGFFHNLQAHYDLEMAKEGTEEMVNAIIPVTYPHFV